MTRAEWDALMREDPGECDRIVANVLFVDTLDDLPGWWPMITGEAGEVYQGLPAFTTSWEAMGELMEKMGDTWFHLARFAKDGPQWRAQFGTDTADCYAPTAPEAVCIAALTALGHMEPGS